MNRFAVLTALLTLSVPMFGLTITSTGCCTSAVGNLTSTITFDGASPNTNDPAGYATYSGSFSYNAASNPGGSGNWISLDNQTAVITFLQPINYFGLLWGTPDSYNSIKLFNGATEVGSAKTGSGVSGYVNFFAGSGEQFTSVQLTSTSCCFETDNHSYRLADTAAAPEPGTVLLAMAGLLPLVYRSFRQ